MFYGKYSMPDTGSNESNPFSADAISFFPSFHMRYPPKEIIFRDKDYIHTTAIITPHFQAIGRAPHYPVCHFILISMVVYATIYYDIAGVNILQSYRFNNETVSKPEGSLHTLSPVKTHIITYRHNYPP